MCEIKWCQRFNYECIIRTRHQTGKIATRWLFFPVTNRGTAAPKSYFVYKPQYKTQCLKWADNPQSWLYFHLFLLVGGSWCVKWVTDAWRGATLKTTCSMGCIRQTWSQKTLFCRRWNERMKMNGLNSTQRKWRYTHRLNPEEVMFCSSIQLQWSAVMLNQFNSEEVQTAEEGNSGRANPHGHSCSHQTWPAVTSPLHTYLITSNEEERLQFCRRKDLCELQKFQWGCDLPAEFLKVTVGWQNRNTIVLWFPCRPCLPIIPDTHSLRARLIDAGWLSRGACSDMENSVCGMSEWNAAKQSEQCSDSFSSFLFFSFLRKKQLFHSFYTEKKLVFST